MARARSRRPPRGPRILAALLIVSAGIAFVGWISGLFSSPSPGKNNASATRTNILVLGVDNIGNGATASRSDSIAVASVQGSDVRLLSIPRDLALKFPDGKLRKVNAAYAMKGPTEGPNYAREVIAKFIDVSIPYYVVIDYSGFADLIDLVGGVTLNVTERMKYDDEAQSLHIDISPGPQRLSGAQALAYVRYRDKKSGNDLGRIRRQQQLLKALVQQGIKFKSAGELNRFLFEAMKYIRTNLTLMDLTRLAQPLKGMTISQVKMRTLEGEPKVDKVIGDYLDPNPVMIREAVEEMLRGQDRVTNDEVRVLTLNGAGKTGLARAVSELLRKQNFVADRYQNADRLDYEKTYIIDLSGGAEKVKRLQKALGPALKNPATVVRPEESKAVINYLNNQGITGSSVDLILIVGNDFVLPAPRE